MADTPSSYSSAKPEPAERPAPKKSCCAWSDLTVAAILLRICAAMLLILSGVDKFKSGAPCTYSTDNYYGTPADLANPKYVPKMVKIVNVVYANSGLDNPNNFTAFGKENSEKIANAFGWSFYRFGQALPWLMIVSGVLILVGLLNRVGHFVGGMVWLSLIIGQLFLPDIETVVRLLVIFVVSVGALALQKHNRFCLTRF